MDSAYTRTLRQLEVKKILQIIYELEQIQQNNGVNNKDVLIEVTRLIEAFKTLFQTICNWHPNQGKTWTLTETYQQVLRWWGTHATMFKDAKDDEERERELEKKELYAMWKSKINILRDRTTRFYMQYEDITLQQALDDTINITSPDRTGVCIIS